jgi:hypothetical protein
MNYQDVNIQSKYLFTCLEINIFQLLFEDHFNQFLFNFSNLFIFLVVLSYNNKFIKKRKKREFLIKFRKNNNYYYYHYS